MKVTILWDVMPSSLAGSYVVRCCSNSKRIAVVFVVDLMIPVTEDYTAMTTWKK
jgi:hypothetical protein